MPFKDKERARENNLVAARKYREREGSALCRARSKLSGEKNPSTAPNAHLRRTYGISLAEFDSLVGEQRGVCAICHRPESVLNRSGQPRRLCVDHSHESGKVRGLLCTKCNKALGLFNDSLEIVLSAALYLEENND